MKFEQLLTQEEEWARQLGKASLQGCLDFIRKISVQEDKDPKSWNQNLFCIDLESENFLFRISCENEVKRYQILYARKVLISVDTIHGPSAFLLQKASNIEQMIELIQQIEKS